VNLKMKMKEFKSERLVLRTESLCKRMIKKTMIRVKKTMVTLKLKKWRQVMSSWLAKPWLGAMKAPTGFKDSLNVDF